MELPVFSRARNVPLRAVSGRTLQNSQDRLRGSRTMDGTDQLDLRGPECPRSRLPS